QNLRVFPPPLPPPEPPSAEQATSTAAAATPPASDRNPRRVNPGIDEFEDMLLPSHRPGHPGRRSSLNRGEHHRRRAPLSAERCSLSSRHCWERQRFMREVIGP